MLKRLLQLSVGVLLMSLSSLGMPLASGEEEIKLTPNASIQDFQNRHEDVKPYNFDAPPEGIVRSIQFAEGFDEEMGYRRSHEIVPVSPKQIFEPGMAPVYVVFSVFPHYEAFQLSGRCFPEAVDGLDPATILAEDTMYLALEDESGYVKLHAPAGGWKTGRYKVEIHVGWKINDISLLGTMRFTVEPNDSNSTAAAEPKEAR